MESMSTNYFIPRALNTYWADTQVNTLEVLRAIDVETLVDDTTLLTRLHSACSQGMPCSLDVVSNPIVNRLVILLSVLDIFVDLAGVERFTGCMPTT